MYASIMHHVQPYTRLVRSHTWSGTHAPIFVEAIRWYTEMSHPRAQPMGVAQSTTVGPVPVAAASQWVIVQAGRSTEALR